MNDGFDENAIDENARRQFELAWIEGCADSIEMFLPPEDDPRYLATLEELVHIELEFSWEASTEGPRVEQYIDRFSRLGQPEILARLVEQECIVRRENHREVTFEDYRERFTDLLDADEQLGRRLVELCDQPTVQFDDTPRAQDRNITTTFSTLPRPFGGYELIEELGRGGMGIVYRARQLQPERIVAIKLIRRDLLESLPRDSRTSAIDRFAQESQAAAQLMHDNIATVYEVGQADGEPFYSMQFVQGESLGERLRDGPLSGRGAAACIEPIARAVQAAHDKGVLHRDLKPQNILIDRQTDRPLVVDFGLAKLAETDSALTTAGEVMGSPPYMPPEQTLDASRVTGQSDIYGLGATLYHAMTGRPPFQAATALETIRQVIEGQPVAPRVLNRGVDRDLETICLKCLEKEPARRYASAADLADDLRRYLEDRPIVARPVGTWERAWRWCRRNPVIASLITVTSVAMVTATIVGTVGYVRTKAALDETRISLRESERSDRRAREVVRRFSDLVSQYERLKQPEMKQLRESLLADALDSFHRFLEERGDDPTVRAEVAQTALRVGRITEQFESPAAALPWYRKAVDVQAALVAEFPEDESYRPELAEMRAQINRIVPKR